jgi:hypothetical protein
MVVAEHYALEDFPNVPFGGGSSIEAEGAQAIYLPVDSVTTRRVRTRRAVPESFAEWSLSTGELL